jgi:hypothetical protein
MVMIFPKIVKNQTGLDFKALVRVKKEINSNNPLPTSLSKKGS